MSFPAGNVENPSGNGVFWRFCRQKIGMHHVGNVGEIPSLLSITVDPRRPTFKERRDPLRHHAGVRRVRRLPRPEDIEVAQAHRLHTIDAEVTLQIKLRRKLLHGIRRYRLRPHRLDARKPRLISVRRRRGRIHNATNTRSPRGFQKIERAFDIGNMRGARVLHRTRNAGKRRLMKDRIDASDRLAKTLRIVEIDLVKINLFPACVEIRTLPGDEVIQPTDFKIAALHQRVYKMGADEARGSSNQNFLHTSQLDNATPHQATFWS